MRRASQGPAGPLLGQPIQTQLIADHWNDLLRLVASMKFGHTTASLLIAKLHASSRQNTLAKALHEYGRLVRTIYVCRYVAVEIAAAKGGGLADITVGDVLELLDTELGTLAWVSGAL